MHNNEHTLAIDAWNFLVEGVQALGGAALIHCLQVLCTAYAVCQPCSRGVRKQYTETTLKENHDLYMKSANAEKADSLLRVHNALGDFIIAVELTSSTVESRQLCVVQLRGSMFILRFSGGY